MQKHRIISLLSILVMLIIPVIGWFLVAQPQIAAAAVADQQRLAAAEQVAATQAVVDQLKVDAANMPELESELDLLRGSIPAGVDPSGYIDGLSALATVSNVEITALTVEDPIAYAAATPPNDPSAVVDGGSGEPVDGETVDPATVPPPAPVEFPGIVTNGLIDSSNFVAIPVTIEVTGKSARILRFVNGLQTGGRLFLVTSFSTEPGAEPGSSELVGKVGGYIWAIPTGIVGDPRPVSTIVKHLESDEPVEEPEPESTATPTPDPTETPAP